MSKRIIHLCTTFGVMMVFFGTSALFAQSATRKDSKTDWSIFVEEPPAAPKKTCWLASAPESVVNTRGGQKVEVQRGEIVLFVLFVPSENRNGEVSFAAGYPFADGATVKLTIGSAEYTLQTDAETAFAIDASEDVKIHGSMKRGATAVLTGQSSRGTNTKDTFSLKGFTAALEQIQKLCGS